MSILNGGYAIPTEEEETAVRGHAGYTFKNPALHCRPKHLFPAADLETAPQAWLDRMTLYLANYCEPVRNIANEIHCVACNQRLTGPQGMQSYKGFNAEQALDVNTESVTLECRCTGCGYPGRARHIMTTEQGQLLVRLDWLPLQYHPTTLSGNARHGV